MITQTISSGVVHTVPRDLRDGLMSKPAALKAWEHITPLARNEWICWIISVKKSETREDHVKRTIIDLAKGKRRPCCWIGCVHRTDKPISRSVKWALNKRTKSN